jgi:hypothetical protein
LGVGAVAEDAFGGAADLVGGAVVEPEGGGAAADFEAGAGEAAAWLVDALVGVAGEEHVVGSCGCEGAEEE